jgi:hypothetical protein
MRFRFASLALAPIVTLALLSLCVVSTVAPRALMAQTNTTGLSGVITDPTGAVVPQAAVELTNPATGYIKVIKSASKGEYAFAQIPPGRYKVTISATGFAPQTEEVELFVATPLNINFKLTIGTTEVVDVAAGLEAVNTTDATLGKAFSGAQVENLPFIANNLNYLLSLQPGVLALDPNNPSSSGPNTSTLTGVVNGARNDQTNLTLDGVDNNDITSGVAFVGILRSTRDSVQEFRVTTTNANADAGRSSGAQVSVSTRSGTNQFHGSAYEFYRDPGIVANNWFVKQAAINAGTPNIPAKVLINTYGASFGAPIIKDKLFFFGAYEGYKYASDAVVTQTVPSVQNPVAGGVLAGTNIGGLVTGNVVYPNCGSPAACTSGATNYVLTPTQIANIDAQCTSPCTTPGTNSAAIAYMNLYPHSNTNTAGDGLNTGGYIFVSPNPNHQITNVARLDYNLNSKQSVFFRGTLEGDNSATALQFDKGPGAVAGASIYGNSKGFAVGHIWNVTNSLTNNLRYGFTRQNNNTQGAGAHNNVSFASFGNLTGTTKNTDYILVTNNFVDDATWVKGKHVVQFGVNDRLITNSRFSASTLYSSAGIQASALAAAKIAGTGGDLDPTAQYGAVQKAQQSNYNNNILANVGGITTATAYTNYLVQGSQLVAAPAGTVPTHIYKSFEQEYYVSDQWKATNRLTITAGVRYLYLGVPYEINGQQIAPSISLGGAFYQNRLSGAAAGSPYATPFAVAPAGQANGKPNLYTPQKFNLAPRLAFAYAPNSKTSIRGGFALAYDHFGSALIDSYDAGGAFALTFANGASYPYPQVTPRFTSYLGVPNVPIIAVSPEQLPIVNPNFTFTNFNGSFVSDINSIQKTPYAETFNLSVQHEIVRGMTVTASYVGRLGRHILANRDVAEPNNLYDSGSNQTYFQAVTAYDKQIAAGTSVTSIPKSGYFQDVFPNATFTQKASSTLVPAGTYSGAQAYYASLTTDAPVGNETNTLYLFDVGVAGTALSTASPKGPYQFFFPEYSAIYTNSSIGVSNYNALQLSVRHSFSHGNEYDFNYTLSKSMDEGSSPERSNSNNIVNGFTPSQMYAVSDFDVRHNITANYTLGLPVGKGQHFFSSPGPIMDRIISGWKLSGTMHYNTGFPWTATDSGYYGTDFSVGSYAVQIAPLATGKRRIVGTGTAAYVTALKSATQAQGQASFRTAYPGETGQRNELRYNGYLDFDDGLSKSFRTYHDQALKLNVEVFNVMNNVVMGAPTGSINSSKFGNYSAIQNQPRQFQFSGKYTF